VQPICPEPVHATYPHAYGQQKPLNANTELFSLPPPPQTAPMPPQPEPMPPLPEPITPLPAPMPPLPARISPPQHFATPLTEGGTSWSTPRRQKPSEPSFPRPASPSPRGKLRAIMVRPLRGYRSYWPTPFHSSQRAPTEYSTISTRLSTTRPSSYSSYAPTIKEPETPAPSLCTTWPNGWRDQGGRRATSAGCLNIFSRASLYDSQNDSRCAR